MVHTESYILFPNCNHVSKQLLDINGLKNFEPINFLKVLGRQKATKLFFLSSCDTKSQHRLPISNLTEICNSFWWLHCYHVSLEGRLSHPHPAGLIKLTGGAQQPRSRNVVPNPFKLWFNKKQVSGNHNAFPLGFLHLIAWFSAAIIIIPAFYQREMCIDWLCPIRFSKVLSLSAKSKIQRNRNKKKVLLLCFLILEI